MADLNAMNTMKAGKIGKMVGDFDPWMPNDVKGKQKRRKKRKSSIRKKQSWRSLYRK